MASPINYRVMAVDLSHWNTVEDWNAVYAAGVIGVMHKATQGLNMIDETYRERIDPAMSAGLKWGAYHYLEPGPDDEIDRQMAHFVDEVQPWDGMRLAIDYEASGLTLNHLRRACSTLLGINSSLQIAIYGGSLLKGQLGDSKDEYLATFALWLAHYSASPSWPTGTWPIWSLQQYSDGDHGPQPRTVAGIRSPCDCNVFNGSDANCAMWFDLGAAPPPEPGTKVVSIKCAGDVAIDVEIDHSLMPGMVEVHCPNGTAAWVVHESS